MKKILLADDSITIQKVVELSFSEGDYEVVCVGNGTQALKKISEVRPDVILLDVIMPDMNGYEVCEQIRRNPVSSSIPILLLTGTFEPFDKRRADGVGADGHLTKPFESHALISKVEQLIAAGTKSPQPIPVSPPSAAADTTADSWAAPEAVPSVSSDAAAPPPPIPMAVEPPPAPSESPAKPMTPPDPSSGGSYLGFTDVAISTEEEDKVVRDRYDDPEPSARNTARNDQDPTVAAQAPGSGNLQDEPRSTPPTPDRPPIEGFVGGYELPREDSQAPPPPAVEASRGPEPAPQQARAVPPPELTPDALEKIADEVLHRMSDRVVREIAWEVIPQVAEKIVKNRIRELEEKDGD